jgi:hypothetical protein
MTENGDPQDNPHRAVGGEATTYRCVFVQRVRKIKFGVASEKCTRDTGIRKVIFFQPPLPSFNHAVASTSKRCWSADGRCGRGVCGPACSCLGWSCVCACCWISTAAVVTLHTCACRSGEGEHNRGEVTLTHWLDTLLGELSVTWCAEFKQSAHCCPSASIIIISESSSGNNIIRVLLGCWDW